MNQYLQRYVVLLFSEINICQVTQYTLTHHFVRRLTGFVVCYDTANQQNQRRQRQQGHHRDGMRNEGHFFVLHELAEKGKVYKDRFNINRADSDKKDLRRRYFLSENNNGISQPQYTFLWLLSCFLSFLAFQLKSWSSGAFLVSRNYLVIFTNSLEAVFKSCTQPDFDLCMAMVRKLNIISFTRDKLPFIGNNGYWRIFNE